MYTCKVVVLDHSPFYFRIWAGIRGQPYARVVDKVRSEIEMEAEDEREADGREDEMKTTKYAAGDGGDHAGDINEQQEQEMAVKRDKEVQPGKNLCGEVLPSGKRLPAAKRNSCSMF